MEDPDGAAEGFGALDGEGVDFGDLGGVEDLAQDMEEALGSHVGCVVFSLRHLHPQSMSAPHPCMW